LGLSQKKHVLKNKKKGGWGSLGKNTPISTVREHARFNCFFKKKKGGENKSGTVGRPTEENVAKGKNMSFWRKAVGPTGGAIPRQKELAKSCRKNIVKAFKSTKKKAREKPSRRSDTGTGGPDVKKSKLREQARIFGTGFPGGGEKRGGESQPLYWGGF